MKSFDYVSKGLSNMGQWKERHAEAMRSPYRISAGMQAPTHERAMAMMVRGWCEYAEAHKKRFESDIGDDGVLGDPWIAIGEALMTLLDGELGRLDGGTLDAILRDNLEEQGFDYDMNERNK